MTVSDCCGAPTKVEYQSDHPHVYDDQYDFKFVILRCTICGKVIPYKAAGSGQNTAGNKQAGEI